MQGRINGSAPLDLLFDVGADTLVTYPSALAKGVRLRFDDEVANAGMGGTTLRRTSDDNRLELANLVCDRAVLTIHDALGSDRVVRQVPITIETSTAGAHHLTNLLGMEVLQRFNVLLDFQTNTVWWKANGSLGAPFKKRDGLRPATVVAGFIVWKRRRAAAPSRRALRI